MSAPRPEFDERFDEIPSGGDVRVTQRRRAEKAERRRLQSRRNALIFIAFVGVLALAIRAGAPRNPQLLVSWPNAQKLGAATLENDATVVIRGGQPFLVTPIDAQNWDVTWHYAGARGDGLPVTWPPAGSLDSLEMNCRPRAQGWARWISWLWPTRNIVLHGTSAVSLGAQRFVVMAQNGAPIRLSSRVVAAQNIAAEAVWDERALPLLEEAARRSSALAPGATWTIAAPSASNSSITSTQNSKNGEPSDTKSSASSPHSVSSPHSAPNVAYKSSTRNVPSSNASADAKRVEASANNKSENGDFVATRGTATYAILVPQSFRDPVEALTQCAQIIAARAPQAGIKWIAREKVFGRQARALLWIDFKTPKRLSRRQLRRLRRSGTVTKSAFAVGARGGWVVRAGDTSATPVDWWNSSPKPKSPTAKDSSSKTTKIVS